MEKKQMNDERQEFLNMKTYPARLNMQEAAWYLGFAAHDMPVMIRAGLLKPLGNPPANGVKYFATTTLTTFYADPKWLARASDTLVKYWRAKNARRSVIQDGQPVI
jgi:hypothetical protein